MPSSKNSPCQGPAVTEQSQEENKKDKFVVNMFRIGIHRIQEQKFSKVEFSPYNENLKHAKSDVEFESCSSGEISMKGEIVKADIEKDVKDV